MRCCCCNSEFHPKWDNEKKVFEKDCPRCVAAYSKKPPNKYALASEEIDDKGAEILERLSDGLGLQSDENITLEDVVRVDRGTYNGSNAGEEEYEPDMDSPNWH